MKKFFLLLICLSVLICTHGQLRWVNADSLFSPLPSSLQIFYTMDSIDGKPNRAFYASAYLKDKSLVFTVDTALNRGITPSHYFERNNQPLLVVNCTFFSPGKRNLNVVIKNGKLLSLNVPSVYDTKDSLWHYVTRSSIGINRNRHAGIEWVYTDSVGNKAFSMKTGPLVSKGISKYPTLSQSGNQGSERSGRMMKKWKPCIAVGGGPNLLSDSKINITNNEERMFAGERINEKHPRTAMGVTGNGHLIILVIEGRSPGIAEGVTLEQEAKILKDLGCIEALNLDGGGSSCMLINGEKTITPSDKTGQRPVPAVFIIKRKN